MDLGFIIKSARKERHLTQAELARQAGVGFATIQNIEAGRANPAYQTIQAILHVLQLEFEIKQARFQWGPLIALGMPLMGQKTDGKKKLKPSSAALIKELSLISKSHLSEFSEREQDALYGFLWALKDHYAYVWQQTPHLLRDWFQKINPQGRHIKLRRMSLSQLGNYL